MSNDKDVKIRSGAPQALALPALLKTLSAWALQGWLLSGYHEVELLNTCKV